MEHKKELMPIELSKLVPSPYNVRRHAVPQVEELAALIDAQGLLHNLIVTEQSVGRGKGRQLRFAVAAGERRRRALLLLQQRGRLPEAHEVLCELVPPERAREISLAENSGREPMHPADEFEAFRALIDEGKGVEDVAARFGVSALTVQRRLKLSAVSPRLLALYRAEGINLDQLMALALSDDHVLQERAWFDASAWDRSPAALRRTLTAGEIEASRSALSRFVGLEAYEAAGGAVRRDLFDDDQSRYVCDSELLRRLAAQKLEALAAEVATEGWAWVEARIEVDAQALRQFGTCEHRVRAATAQEQIDLDELCAREAELARQGEELADAAEWSADEAECIDLEEQAIAERRKAIMCKLKTWTVEVKAHAGVIVTISREGEPELLRGLVRDQDRKKLAAASRADRSAPSRTQQKHGAVAQPAKPECSDSLQRRLAAHRTMAMQVMLARNTSVALASLAHVFVLRLFGDGGFHGVSAFHVVPASPMHALLNAADDLKGSPAWQAFEAARSALKERLPVHGDALREWLIKLPQEELLELLALCTACTLNAMPAAGAQAESDAIAEAVGLDMADWWEPTSASYLSHVSKAQILQALKEAGPDLIAGLDSGQKKNELVAQAATKLRGKRWLPALLRRQRGPSESQGDVDRPT